MKPFHKDNTLFFFKLYPRTNGSLFSVERLDSGFHPHRPFLGVHPPLNSFFISELLRGWGGGRGGGQEPPSHPRWGPTTRVWGHLVLGQLGLGDNDGSAFIPGQLGIRYVQVNSSAGPFSTSTVRSCPATCFTVYVHREGPYTAGTAGWECRG